MKPPIFEDLCSIPSPTGTSGGAVPEVGAALGLWRALGDAGAALGTAADAPALKACPWMGLGMLGMLGMGDAGDGGPGTKFGGRGWGKI